MAKRKPALLAGSSRCRLCKRSFEWRAAVAPDNCGANDCRFEAHATETEWEGRARQAIARQAGGITLSRLDEIALAKFPHPRSIWLPPRRGVSLRLAG